MKDDTMHVRRDGGFQNWLMTHFVLGGRQEYSTVHCRFLERPSRQRHKRTQANPNSKREKKPKSERKEVIRRR